MGLLCFNALTAADLVLIPIEMSLFGMHGIDRMYEVIRELRERHGRDIPVRVLPTLVDSRTRLCRQFLHEVGERFADDVLSVMVQFTVRLKEAVRQGMPIIAYDPDFNRCRAVRSPGERDDVDVAEPCHRRRNRRRTQDRALTAMKRVFEEARSRLTGQGGLQKVVLRFYDFAGRE